ncbi:UNVERIFIED_CONTAM: hypothetical protein GTU68_052120 [Idotea baltica]|nr:hypothetical protein [Idotea baltica]
MTSQSFKNLVTDDFNLVDTIINEQLNSNVPLVEKIGDYIVSAGGKRLRPLLVLLSGKTLGMTDKRLHLLAAIIEFLHTATLLHDDVVDTSNMRRGRETANEKWGNAPSVLVGDFLYSRSFEMMVQLGSMPVMKILSCATRVIAEGEVLQLTKIHDASTTEATYMQVIKGKTAMLFEASTHSAAVLSNASAEQIETSRNFGDNLGIAFQLFDDLLDYQGDSNALGKNIGDDLNEGKVTLPLIYAMKTGSPTQIKLIREAIQKGGTENLFEIQKAVKDTGALNYTKEKANHFIHQAIQCLEKLPSNQYSMALGELCDFSINRSN